MQHRIPQEAIVPIGIALALCLLGGALLPLFFLRKNRPMHAVRVRVTRPFCSASVPFPLFGIIAEDRSAKGLAAFVEKRLYPGDLLAQYATLIRDYLLSETKNGSCGLQGRIETGACSYGKRTFLHR